MKTKTKVVHSGRVVGPHGEVSPSITTSTTFARSESGELVGDHLYSRLSNPNRTQLENALATLEGGARGLCFASGSAAANALFQTLSPGDGVCYGHDLYYGVRELLHRFDLRATEGVASLPDDTKLVIVETPTNPLADIVDIAELAARAHEVGASLVVDNTWATPVLQTPLALGADFVLHSTTKYIGGHSDVVGGAIVAADVSHPITARLDELQRLGGAVPSPFDCWLLLRGLSTLAVRMSAHCDNAQGLAEWLASHPKVERVRYPGLTDHPSHGVAKAQMARFGGMLSFELASSQAAKTAVSRLSLFTVATSLGGVHSLAEHRIVVDANAPPSLVRLSIGIEDEADLRADLEQALSAVQ